MLAKKAEAAKAASKEAQDHLEQLRADSEAKVYRVVREKSTVLTSSRRSLSLESSRQPEPTTQLGSRQRRSRSRYGHAFAV